MQKQYPTFILTGGGTGGHLFPALAIADELRRSIPGCKILFVGSKDKIEARVVPQHGYEFKTIWISGFHRRLRFANILFPLKVAVACLQSLQILRRHRPDVVIGTGGYVCGPIGVMASMMRIPLALHESNSYPGVTTRLLAKRAAIVFTAFDATSQWLKDARRIERVGTPIRHSLSTVSREEAVRFFNMDPEKKTILIFGGSLGATTINNAMLGMLGHLQQETVQLIWQTGSADYDRIRNIVAARNIGWFGPFIDRMDLAYAAADLVVCRSGAATIAELTALGKAAVLIPYPYAAADHQTYNARTLVEQGAAVTVRDEEVSEKLPAAVSAILNSEAQRQAMEQKSKALGAPHAARVIAAKILSLIDYK